MSRLRSRAPEIGFFASVLVVALLSRMPSSVGALGLLNGAVIALNAIGMLLIMRTDRIINFAQVQIGIVGATLFVIFARYLPLLSALHNMCPACLERVTPFEYKVNYVVGAFLGIGLSILLGWLCSTVLMRRLSSQSRLIATVATLFLVPVLGLVQRLLENVLVTSDQKQLASGVVVISAPYLPWTGGFRWGPAIFGIPQLLTLLCAGGGVALVWWFMRRTTSGASLRAVADNADRAETLGLNSAKIRSRAWVLSAAVSGIAATTVALTQGAPSAGTLVVSITVQILVVLVLARFTSIPFAILGALALGLAQNAFDWWLHSSTILDGILVGVIALLLLGQVDLSSRAERLREATSRFAREIRGVPAELRGHQSVRTWTRVVAFLVIASFLAFPWIMSPSQVSLGTVALLLGMIGLSLLVLTGWAGQISLGHMAFAGIGAYVAQISRLPFPLAIVVGALAGALVAALVGIPALRLRGMQLAVITLALALAASTLLFDENRLGKYLPANIKRPGMLHLTDDRAYYYLVLAFLALTVVAVAGMRRSRFARALIGARDNDGAAASFAIPVVRIRIQAFAISGFIAAFAGALLMYQQLGLRTLTYAPEQSLYVFLWTVIGGLGAISGPVLGAVLHGVLDLFGSNEIAQFIVSGLGGVLLLVAIPGGVARVVFDIRDGMLRRFAQRERIVVPSLLADVSVEGDHPRAEIAPREAFATLPARYSLDDQWALKNAKEPVGG
ncbi:MAG: ABC transporter permease subunit [Actinomycetota bacterium]